MALGGSSTTRVMLDLIGRDSASPAFLKAASTLDTVSGRMIRMGSKMQAVGTTLTRKLTLPIVAAAAVSVKLDTTFTSTMRRIQTQAGGSAKDVQTLSKQVLALSSSTQQGPVQLAQALYHLKSVGMSNVSAMDALRQSSKLAAVSGADLEETTNALAGAWRTGIRGAKSFGQTVASLNAIVGSGNMTLTDLNSALGTGILPTAKTFGLTLHDVGSALALFTDEGVPADAAATRLRMTFSLLGAPTQKAQGQLASIGITANQLGRDMRKPDGLLVAITDLKKHLDASGLSATQQAALLSRAFGGGRSSSAIMSMVNNLTVLGQKYDQQTKLANRFNAAVAAQAQTPAAKFATLRSNLEKLGIEFGDDVLPSVLDVTRAVEGLLGRFDDMSPTARKIVVDGALIAAALGPVIGIAGRVTKSIGVMVGAGAAIGRFTAGMTAIKLAEESMATGSYSAGLKVRSLFVSMASGAATMGRGIVRSIKAAAASIAAIPAAMRGAEGVGGKLAAIGSGAAGAAGALGPLGVGLLAVGSAAALGYGIWDNYKKKQEDAAAAAARNQAVVQSLTQAIEADNYAVGQQTKIQLAHNLQQAGAVAAAEKVHLSLTTVTQAAMGNAAAMKQVYNVGADIAKQELKYVGTTKQLPANIGAQATAFGRLKAILGTQRGQLGNAMQQAKAYAGLLGKQSSATNGTTSATKGATAAQGKFRTALNQTGQASANLSTTLTKLGNYLSNAQAVLAFQQALQAMRKQLKGTNGELQGTSTKALANRSAFEDVASAILGSAQSMQQLGKSGPSIVKSINSQVAALRAQAIQAGASKGEVNDLLRRLHLMPKQIETRFTLADGGVVSKIKRIGNLIETIVGNHVISFSTVGNGRGTKASPYASGGSVRDGWFTVGEEGGPRGFELGHKSGSNVQIFSNKKSRAMTGMGRVPGYASGTTPGISTTTVGGDKKWVYDGIKYASLSAAQNAQHRAATNTSAIGSAIGSIGSAAGSKFYVKDVGITRIMTQIGKAFSVLEAQIGRGLKAKAAKPFEDELNRYLKLAQKQLTNLRAKINGQDLSALKKSLTGTAAGAAAAFSSLIKDARNAGFSTATLDRLIAQQKKLTAVMRERAQVTSKLTAAQQVSSGVQSSFTGFFDVTSAGGTTDSNGNAVAPTFGSLFAAIKQAANQSKRFVSVVKKLAKEGLSRVLVAQLAQAGPAALPQALALASATPKQLAQFNSQSKIITTSGTTLGDFTAGLTAKTKTGGYANGVAAAQGYINGLKSQKKHLTDETEKIFNEAGKVVGKATKQEVVLSAKTIAELKAAFKDALSDVDLGVELDGKKVERASKKAQHRLARLG